MRDRSSPGRRWSAAGSDYDELLFTLIEAAPGKIALEQNSDMRKIPAWVGWLRNRRL